MDITTVLLQPLLLAVVFTLLGVGLFAGCLWLIVKLSPFSIRKEIEEDQNTALAVLMGAVVIGLSIIIAAAIL